MNPTPWRLRRAPVLAAAGALSLILATGCTSSSPPAPAAPAGGAAAPPAPAPAATAAGGSGTQPPAAPTGDALERPTSIQDAYIQGNAFRPAALTVPVGSVVLWSNQDDEQHTVTGPGWELGPMGKGQAWAHTFKQVGTETITCRLHPEMKMTVTVTEAKP